MKKRKYIVITIIIISFIGLALYTLTVQKELQDYKMGFYLKGTYQTDKGLPVNAEYLAFSQEKENGNNIFYYFMQDDFKEKGYYINTDNANLYRLSIDNTNIDGSYILVGKDSVYIINDINVLEFKKVSDEVVFINQ